MKAMSTYSVKIKEYNHIFKDTVRIYRAAVDFFIDVMLREWDTFATVTSQIGAVNLAEQYCVKTGRRPVVKYDFAVDFYKFPSYLRRSAIAQAYGKAASYQSNRKNWEKKDSSQQGDPPGYPKAGYVYPALYRDNCYVRQSDYTASIKVFRNNTWDWVRVDLKKSDVDYILKHCSSRKECTPTLQKRGKEWFLDFPFEEIVTLHETPIFDQMILSADLGLNSSATCVVMAADGTILGRHFLKLSREYDSLRHKLSHIKYAQRHGSRKISNLWKIAKGVNDDIAVKTANFIMSVAKQYDVNTIVFEHLDLNGKKKGSKKERLHLWKAKYVQTMVMGKAHRLGMRIRHVNAWGTSRLAFDGSGRVKRGSESSLTGGSYSLCEFSTGKVYNCDLNAAYNIGARYCVREIMKSLPVTDGQRIAAKVPECVKRSTCTLSTLINLYAELYAVA